MIRLNDHIWIGGSGDEKQSELHPSGISAILNVAQDLEATRGWSNEIEYMQVGLLDGPGNPAVSYCAAILALHTLLQRHRGILVCCHEGGRSLAIVLMYMHATSGRDWDDCLALLAERVNVDLPVPNDIHRDALDKLPWKLLKGML